MTAAIAWILVAVAALTTGACGNYSNEDLEFMSALPQRDDVSVEIPRRASLSTLGIADGWRTTLEVTHGFNGVADAFLSLIEKVRSYYPTTRNRNERIWGPFPSDENPGWRMEFHMTKTGLTPAAAVFTYQLVMLPPPGVVLPPGPTVTPTGTTIISGHFSASAGVRVGEGHLEVTLEGARAAGVVFPNLEKLVTLTIDYNTRDWPRHVEMTVINLPPTDPDDAAMATYVYERAENGDGAMTFTFPKDVVPAPAGTPALDETLMVESRWLGIGPGRADISVTGGNVAGAASSIECWGNDFRQAYKLESWNPAGAIGDAAVCISKL